MVAGARTTGLEDQRHECSPADGLLFVLPVGLLAPGKGGYTAIATLIAQRGKVGV